MDVGNSTSTTSHKNDTSQQGLADLGNALGIDLHYLSPDFQLNRKLVNFVRKSWGKYLLVKADTKVNGLLFDITVSDGISQTKTWAEAQNQIFVASSTSIPVPKVFAAFSDGPIRDRDFGDQDWYDIYVLMEAVPGAPLSDIWDNSTREVKRALSIELSAELKGYINQLREIQGGTYIGSLGNGPVLDHYRLPSADNRGPFATESEFNAAIEIDWKRLPGGDRMPDRIYEELEAHKHEIKFTHANLRFRHIMVENGHISSIVGWHAAGWYPSYWECANSLSVTKPDLYWETFWKNAIEKPHPDVLKTMKKLDRAHI